MSILTEKQIEYGYNYFHKDEPDKRCIVEVSDYKGEEELIINCTQLGDSFTPQYKTAKDKKRVLEEWCDFLKNNKRKAVNILIFSSLVLANCSNKKSIPSLPCLSKLFSI